MISEEKLQRIAKELDGITGNEWEMIQRVVSFHFKKKRVEVAKVIVHCTEEDLLKSLMRGNNRDRLSDWAEESYLQSFIEKE